MASVTTQVYRDAVGRQVEPSFDFGVLCCEGDIGCGGYLELPLPAAAKGGRSMTMLVPRGRQSIRRSEGLVEIHGRLREADELPVRLTRRMGKAGFEFVLAS